MSTELRFDAVDIARLGRAINNLPGEIKTKAMARAMRRMRDMARSRIVKRSAERTNVSQKVVRELTTAHYNAGGNTIDIVEKAGWIPLYKLGAVETPRGVRVRSRGSYRHAFLAEMDSGHRGVFRRVPGTRMPSNKHKEAIRELFGPNPAHDVTNNPDVFLNVLAELIQNELLPRTLHEVGRLLPR